AVFILWGQSNVKLIENFLELVVFYRMLDRLPEYLRDTVDWFMGHSLNCVRYKKICAGYNVIMFKHIICWWHLERSVRMFPFMNSRKVVKYTSINTDFVLDVDETVTCFCRRHSFDINYA
ncbi:hypothetical protein L9F63_019572, partial [Diploptera punctata]